VSLRPTLAIKYPLWCLFPRVKRWKLLPGQREETFSGSGLPEALHGRLRGTAKYLPDFGRRQNLGQVLGSCPATRAAAADPEIRGSLRAG